MERRGKKSRSFSLHLENSGGVQNDRRERSFSDVHAVSHLPPIDRKTALKTVQSKKIRFYKDGDKNFGGIEMCVSNQRYRSLNALIADLNGCINLARGVRTISTPSGQHTVNDITELEHGRSYVCSSSTRIKKIDYRAASKPTWNHFSKSKRDTARRLGAGGGDFSKHSLDSNSKNPSRLISRSTPVVFHNSHLYGRKKREGGSKESMMTLTFNSQWVQRPLQLLYSRTSHRDWDTLLGDVAKATKVPRGSVPQILTANDGRKIESVSQLLHCNCCSFLVVTWNTGSGEGGGRHLDHKQEVSSTKTSPLVSPLPRPEVTGKSSPDLPPPSSEVSVTEGTSETEGKDAGDGLQEEPIESPKPQSRQSTEENIEACSQSERTQPSSSLGDVKSPSCDGCVHEMMTTEDGHKDLKLDSHGSHVDDNIAIEDTGSDENTQNNDSIRDSDDQNDSSNASGNNKGLVESHVDVSDQGLSNASDLDKDRKHSQTCSQTSSSKEEPPEEEPHPEDPCVDSDRGEEGSSKEGETSASVQDQMHSEGSERAEDVKAEMPLYRSSGSPINFLDRRDRSSSFLSDSSVTSWSLTSAAAIRPGAFYVSGVKPDTPTSSLMACATPHVIKMKMDLPMDFEDQMMSNFEEQTASSFAMTSTKRGSKDTTFLSQSKEDTSDSETKEGKQNVTVSRKRRLTDEYELGTTVSKGTYADMLECTHMKTSKKYLLKKISKTKIFAHEDIIEKELAIIRLLNHPNIIKIEEEFEDEEHYHCVMEHINGGDLYFAILECHHFSEKDVAIAMWSLGHALMYLHNHHIVHRGVSAESIFIAVNPNGSKTLKLGNFSTAIFTTQPLSVICGSVPYIAPEMLLGTGYGTKVDLWATGVVCYVMLCGVSPFNTCPEDKNVTGKNVSSRDIVVEKIKTCRFNFESPIWNSVSECAKEFISKLLVASPRKRMSAEDMLRESWLRSVQDSVEDGFMDLPCYKSGTKLGFVVTALDKMVKDPNRTYRTYKD